LKLYDTNLQDLHFLKKIINKNYNIKIVANKKNQGAGYYINVGIKKSTSNIIDFLDADDYWHKKNLKFNSIL